MISSSDCGGVVILTLNKPINDHVIDLLMPFHGLYTTGLSPWQESLTSKWFLDPVNKIYQQPNKYCIGYYSHSSEINMLRFIKALNVKSATELGWGTDFNFDGFIFNLFKTLVRVESSDSEFFLESKKPFDINHVVKSNFNEKLTLFEKYVYNTFSYDYFTNFEHNPYFKNIKDMSVYNWHKQVSSVIDASFYWFEQTWT